MLHPFLRPGARGTIDRRAFLRRAGAALPAAGLLLTASPFEALAADEDPRLVRSKEPLNLEFPFASLNSFITPNERFYVRNHFPIPKLDPATWRLKIEGAVKKESELTYDQIRKLPTKTVTATLECAGNGRSLLNPKQKGVQWDLGAVSNAEWTGVPLSAVLEEAGMDPEAAEVVFEGADQGTVTADPKPADPVLHFARSLPVAKARKPEVLLAYRMNGKELPVNNGFPVRLLVPGWYGMASIKWLQRLIVTKDRFGGYFQTIDYSTFGTLGGVPQVVPIRELQVKSEIARPHAGEEVKAGAEYRIQGAAWTGESEIAKVELSLDGGKSWKDTKFLDKPLRYAWRRWEYVWTPEKAGAATLMVRATDAQARMQPEKRDPNRRNYMINHVVPVEVMVK